MRKNLRRLMTTLAATIAAAGLAVPNALANMNVIDVSDWQPANITQVVDYDGAIVKVNQGDGYINGSWRAQADSARARGKACGLYDYAAGGNAVSEADTFFRETSAYIGSCMLVLDWEQFQNAAWGNSSWVDAWVARVHERTKVWPVIYVQRSAVWQISPWARSKCMLWVAQYATNIATGWQSDPWNAGASGEGMLQYTSHGLLPGHYGYLDLSVFFGDRSAWEKIACGERSNCGTTPVAPAAPSTRTETTTTDLNALASSVIRGDYGNGQERKSRLGSNYDAVMAIVNQRLAGQTVTAPTVITTTRTYVVRSGDTMSAIAARTGLMPVTAWSVPSGNLNVIYPGQTVVYRGVASAASYGSASHVVRSGESLWSIYGAGWYAAAQRNGISAPYTIYPGQRLS